MNYNIVRFDDTMLSHLPHHEEPFNVIGRLVPEYNGKTKTWTLSEELLEIPREKTYPDIDIYNPKDYINNENQTAFLAVLNNECIGSIRVCKRWNKNAFIDDLKVNRAYRGYGIATVLMNEAVNWSRENNLYGVSLETQDWNLLACRFYLKYGYKLGGIDCKVYKAFEESYRKETALYFYLLPDEN